MTRKGSSPVSLFQPSLKLADAREMPSCQRSNRGVLLRRLEKCKHYSPSPTSVIRNSDGIFSLRPSDPPARLTRLGPLSLPFPLLAPRRASLRPGPLPTSPANALLFDLEKGLATARTARQTEQARPAARRAALRHWARWTCAGPPGTCFYPSLSTRVLSPGDPRPQGSKATHTNRKVTHLRAPSVLCPHARARSSSRFLSKHLLISAVVVVGTTTGWQVLHACVRACVRVAAGLASLGTCSLIGNGRHWAEGVLQAALLFLSVYLPRSGGKAGSESAFSFSPMFQLGALLVNCREAGRDQHLY